MFPHAERALRTTPNGELSVWVVLRGRILWLDVSLMHHGGKELALHDHGCILKTFLNIADLLLIMRGNIAGNLALFGKLIGPQVPQ